MNSRISISALTVSAVAALAVACSATVDSSAEDVGQASAAITQVPAQVACIEVNVVGARTVDRRFDVVSGQSSVLALNGLPTGVDTFSGLAYPVACANVNGTTATWVSDPVAATLSAGTVTSVTLVLHKNGGASVGVDFQDDDAGACSTVTTCAAQGKTCGTASDGCGGTLNCGTCSAGQICSSSSVCAACGGAGQPCCAGNTCSGTGCCDTGPGVCLALGSACSGGRVCGAGNTCH